MGYKILGINLSHNSSVCVLEDGEIIFFLEEDRLSRNKHDAQPLYLISYVSSLFKIDEISISGLMGYYDVPFYLKAIILLLEKLFPNTPINFKHQYNHHLAHSTSAFYNSGFSKALSIVIDGMGGQDEQSKGFETETIQIIEYPLKVQNIYKSYITEKYTKCSNKEIFSPLVSLCKVYEGVNYYLNFKWNELGKVMGLSSYGKFDSTIPNLYINGKGNPDIALNQNLECKINLPPISNEWHKNSFKITDFEKNLAYKVQQESQQEVGNLIEKSLKETGLKQVCCAGGYFLNCVANYYLKKRFPDIKFYFEPIANDAGTAIGAAKLLWQSRTKDKTIRPQKTLYYGPKYTKKQLLKGIKKYLD